MTSTTSGSEVGGASAVIVVSLTGLTPIVTRRCRRDLGDAVEGDHIARRREIWPEPPGRDPDDDRERDGDGSGGVEILSGKRVPHPRH